MRKLVTIVVLLALGALATLGFWQRDAELAIRLFDQRLQLAMVTAVVAALLALAFGVALLRGLIRWATSRRAPRRQSTSLWRRSRPNALLGLVIIAVGALLTHWVLQRDFTLAISAGERSFSVTLGEAIVIYGGLVLLLHLLLSAISWLILLPGDWRRGQEALRQERILAGFLAVAAGDGKRAQRLLQRLKPEERPLPLSGLLLAAQAAALCQQPDERRRYGHALLNAPGGEAVGLRLLMEQAAAEGDYATALTYGEQRFRRGEKGADFIAHLLALCGRAERWERAEEIAAEAAEARLLESAQLARTRAIAATQLAAQAFRQRATATARRHIERALQHQPDFIPAHLLRADIALQQSGVQGALEAIRSSWPKAPHPTLGQQFLRLQNQQSPKQLLRQVERLVGSTQRQPESAALLASAALAAERLERAEEVLRQSLAQRTTFALCQLMLEVVLRQGGDQAALRRWTQQLAAAPLDPTWVCQSCYQQQQQWLLVCPRCQSYDSYRWQSPTPPRVSTAAEESSAAARSRGYLYSVAAPTPAPNQALALTRHGKEAAGGLGRRLAVAQGRAIAAGSAPAKAQPSFWQRLKGERRARVGELLEAQRS